MKLTQEKIQRMISGSGSGSSSGSSISTAGYASMGWVEENYLSKPFFQNLFTVNGSGGEITPNDVETAVTSIDVECGVWNGMVNIDNMLYFDTTNNRIGIGGLGAPQYALHVNGDIKANGNMFTNVATGSYIQIGQIRLIYDHANNAIKVEKSDGTAANFYATGSVSALE